MVNITPSWFAVLILCQFQVILMQAFHLFHLAITRKLTRVFLHTKGMALKGHKSILIRTVDTDVLLLSLASFFHLAGEIDQFWINFGTEKNRQLTVCRPEFTIYRPYRFLMLIFLKLHTIVSHNKHVNSKHWNVNASQIPKLNIRGPGRFAFCRPVCKILLWYRNNIFCSSIIWN